MSHHLLKVKHYNNGVQICRRQSYFKIHIHPLLGFLLKADPETGIWMQVVWGRWTREAGWGGAVRQRAEEAQLVTRLLLWTTRIFGPSREPLKDCTTHLESSLRDKKIEVLSTNPSPLLCNSLVHLFGTCGPPWAGAGRFYWSRNTLRYRDPGRYCFANCPQVTSR